jgi:hypothetical protein
MACPSKLNPEIQKRIGENIALGLTYSLAAEAAVLIDVISMDNLNGLVTKFSGQY